MLRSSRRITRAAASAFFFSSSSVRSIKNNCSSVLFRGLQTTSFKASYNPIRRQPLCATTNFVQRGCFATLTHNVPSMGDSISEGTVVEWKKDVGQFVAADEVVVVLETDKVTVDVNAPCDGTITKHFADLDDTVEVGQALFDIEEGEAKPSTESSSTKSSSTESTPSNKADLVVNVPSMGDSISEGTVVTVVKSPGEYVQADEVVLVVETDKVSVDINAPSAGQVVEILTSLDDVVQVGTPVFKINTQVEAPSTTKASVPETKPEEKASVPETKPELKPEEKKSSSSRNETRVKMSPMRLQTAAQLKNAQNTAAILTTFQEVNVSNLLEMHSLYKDQEGGLGLLSSFVKASVAALTEFPAVNGTIDSSSNEIVYHEYCDIAIDVATPTGVINPVLRNVEQLSTIMEIESQIALVTDKATNQKTLAIEDLVGGTFSISNAGVYNALLSTPMLAFPQSAALGLHQITMRPMEDPVTKKIVPTPMMFVALTYDHRIIDGREAVLFLKSIANKVEDPRRMLLGI